MARRLFIGLMTLLLASAPGRAEKAVLTSADRGQEVSIQLGAFVPTARFGLNGVAGNPKEHFGVTGFLFAADYLHALTPILSVGLEGLFINRGDYELHNVAGNPGSKTLVRGDTKAVLATLRFGRRPGSGFRPYILGGVGIHQTTMDVFIQAPPGGVWVGGFGEELGVIHGSASGPIGVLRAGIEHQYTDGGTLGIEAGWIGIPAQRYSRTVAGRTVVGLPSDVVSRGDGLSIAATFGYRFGGGP